MGVAEIDYQANKVSVFTSYWIYYNVYLSFIDSTKMRIGVNYLTGCLNSIKISILVIDKDFFPTNIFSSSDHLFSIIAPN